MKTIALVILTIMSLRKVVQAMLKQSNQTYDELAYILFATVSFYLMYMEVI